MDARDVQRLLRADAARLDAEIAKVDRQRFIRQVLDRLGLSPDPEDRTAGPIPRR